ncbi:MAG: hypothetical protein HY291_13575 [Planctomycetes bacterium]|nr:hypothetical protein [Planctomycetota bacterium]
MNRTRIASLLAVGSLLLTLTGCFDYTEETKFDEKGAGKLSIVFNLGDLSTVEKIAAGMVKKNPINKENFEKDLPAGVKLAEYREEIKNEQKTIYATYEFDDLNKLGQWKANDKDDQLFRTLSLNKVGDI